MSDSNATIKDSQKLCRSIVTCLENGKGLDIKQLNVSELTTVADFMVLVTGSSSRHVKALATNAVSAMRDQGVRARGIEGEETGDWVLIDFGDVIVHVMQASVREFYDLEGLWQAGFGEALSKRVRKYPE